MFKVKVLLVRFLLKVRRDRTILGVETRKRIGKGGENRCTKNVDVKIKNVNKNV